MIKFVKMLVPKFIIDYKQKLYQKKLINNWKNANTDGAPPHIVKQLHIKNIRDVFALNTLIETGTYLGAMVVAQQNNFKSIYTIEVSEKIYKEVSQNLKHIKHAQFILGDSGEVLKTIMPNIKESALFWLDGHYSGGITSKGDHNTPIYKELNEIFNAPFQHAILIDDARDFTGKDDYPTIDELNKFVTIHKPDYFFKVKDNIIFILPKAVDVNII